MRTQRLVVYLTGQKLEIKKIREKNKTKNRNERTKCKKADKTETYNFFKSRNLHLSKPRL